MGQAFKTARDRVILFNDEPMTDRQFFLAVIDPNRVKFDADASDLEAALGDEDPEKVERVALRTQIIDNPLQPVDVGNKILQFFAVNPNQGTLVRDRRPAILFENVDGTETPLFQLNPDEVWELAHGGGFATTLYVEGMEPVLATPK